MPEPAAGGRRVEVRAGARLHLGFLDLTGDYGRRFGSFGLAIDGYDTRIVLREADADSVLREADAESVEGAERERTLGLLRRLREAHGTRSGVAAQVRTAIPAHAGLGSGTQLALGVARAFRILNGIAPDTRADAAALMRGARSGLGVALFDRGGFVLDGGRGAATDVPPVLAHLRFPPDWRVVLLRDDSAAGAHGEAERAAFAQLPVFPAQASADLCRRALLQVLPGVAEADFTAFGEGVSAIQARLGDHFAPAQGGGRFTSAIVGRAAAELARAGAVGLGQSSWGPTGFVFARDPDEAAHWARRARETSNVGVAIHASRETGAEIQQTFEEFMAKTILHMLTPLAHMSPFDVNMAADAGFDVVATYTHVKREEVEALIQDAMFSRSPKDAVRTGIFIAGKDAFLALDMLDIAGKALLKPFEISLFADPAGSFTTAAAMLAVVEKTFAAKFGGKLAGARIAIFGATGVVGTAAGVIGALEGAEVTFVGHNGAERVARTAAEAKRRFGVEIAAVDGATPQARASILESSDIALCAARAGVQVLDAAAIAGAKSLKVAADVNAVPPLGVEGVSLHANGEPLGPNGAVGVGALAIGDVKYRTESGLFKQMTESAKALKLDFRQAFALARTLS